MKIFWILLMLVSPTEWEPVGYISLTENECAKTMEYMPGVLILKCAKVRLID